MKKILPLVFAILLLLTACGKKPLFGVSTNEDNSISVLADRGPKDSMGIGYLTVGENEQVVVDAGFNPEGKISLRFMSGTPGDDGLPGGTSYEASISGSDSMSFSVDPGTYTVALFVQSKVTGSALIRTEACGETALPGSLADDFIGIWTEKTAGRCTVEITGQSDGQYGIHVFWGGTASDMSFWSMTASPVESNVLRYSDCVHSVITLSEDEAETEVIEYENGTGEFTLLSTNELMWQDDVGQAGDNLLFVSEG